MGECDINTATQQLPIQVRERDQKFMLFCTLICVCVYLDMYVSLHACTYVCMYVCMYMYVCNYCTDVKKVEEHLEHCVSFEIRPQTPTG